MCAVSGLNWTLPAGVSSFDYDVIILTETWLNDAIPSSLLFDDAFVVFRCNRSSANSTRARGAGVLIACSSSLVAGQTSSPFPSLEAVWVRIKHRGSLLHLGAIYIPPYQSSSSVTFERLVNYGIGV